MFLFFVRTLAGVCARGGGFLPLFEQGALVRLRHRACTLHKGLGGTRNRSTSDVGAFIVLTMSRIKYQSDYYYTGLNYQVFIIANACWSLY